MDKNGDCPLVIYSDVSLPEGLSIIDVFAPTWRPLPRNAAPLKPITLQAARNSCQLQPGAADSLLGQSRRFALIAPIFNE